MPEPPDHHSRQRLSECLKLFNNFYNFGESEWDLHTWICVDNHFTNFNGKVTAVIESNGVALLIVGARLRQFTIALETKCRSIVHRLRATYR